MRYVLTSKSLPLSQIELETLKVGAKEITKTKLLGHLFCELDEEQAKTLARVSGLVVKPVKQYCTDQVTAVAQPVETVSDVFYLLRSYFAPPLTGTGLTVAVLDSGIRKSHQSLRDKIIYEARLESGNKTA